MVDSNNSALGILFPNTYDSEISELVNDRLMASIPFASRYRMVDFILSSMSNCGISNVSVLARKNYNSLMEHLGSGREWDLVRKNGGLNIVPPFAEKGFKVYNDRIDALASIMIFLKSQKEKYVVMSDTNLAVNFDFQALLRAHIKSGADVTIAYKEQELPESVRKAPIISKELYYTLGLENDRVKKIYFNSKEPGVQNISLNIYVFNREFLIKQVEVAFARGCTQLERDILVPQLDELNVQAYRFDGYVARICNFKTYFDENMKLLKNENVDALFSPDRPIYTKIRDDSPTRYISGSIAKNVMVADGCLIEGDVENSILFRGVKVAKGAKVKNCILMQDTVVEPGAHLEYIVTDKEVTISAYQELKGNDSFPVYVAKHQVI